MSRWTAVSDYDYEAELGNLEPEDEELPEDTHCTECGRSDGHDEPNGTCGKGRRVRNGEA